MAESELNFTFDGKNLTAKNGDTIASALWRNGIKVITRSIKFHRPRGLYCGTGNCPNCLANVNGIPNVRICTTQVEQGMLVIPQNKILSRNLDPVGIMDYLYAGGFNYHHKFIRPRFATGVYQGIIRRMTGIGRLPISRISTKPTLRLNFDVIVIGDEAQAVKIADVCSRANLKVLIARNPAGTDSPVADLQNIKNVKFIDNSSVIGAFDDGSIGIATKNRLLICKSKIKVIAEKGKELPLRFDNWDLPGIIQKSAAIQLVKQNIALGKNIIITGEALDSAELAETIKNRGSMVSKIVCKISDEEKIKKTEILMSNWSVIAAIGRKELRKIKISDGTNSETLACDCLVTCGPLAPNIELARQLGCAIKSDARMFPFVAVNVSFETSKKGIFSIGSSTGQMNTKKSLEDESAASKAIIQRAQEMRS